MVFTSQGFVTTFIETLKFLRVQNNFGQDQEWYIPVDGQRMRWPCYTGTKSMPFCEIDDIAQSCLELPAREVGKEVQKRFTFTNKKESRSLIFHFASPFFDFLRKDIASVIEEESPLDFATGIETRAVSLAKPGDISVGRTSCWKDATSLFGVQPIDVGGRDYYYLSHFLLHCIMQYERGETVKNPIQKIIDVLKEVPEIIIRVYCLDTETQIILLWLLKQSGHETLYLDSNGVEVAQRWNRKGPLYPVVTEVLDISVDDEDPFKILDEETKYSDYFRVLGIRIPRFPGYLIPNNTSKAEDSFEMLLAAAELLRERYGLEKGCLKPSRGNAGSRIVPGLDLQDSESLCETYKRLYSMTDPDDFILEAHIEYDTIDVEGFQFSISPSSHIRFGEVAHGITLQHLSGKTWQGNLFLDRDSVEDFGISGDEYDQIQYTMELFNSCFQKRATENKGARLITAGIDFAKGKIFGKFGSVSILGAIDPNLRFNGAEFLRAAIVDNLYVVTFAITPTSKASLSLMTDAINSAGVRSQARACIPNRWGILASFGNSPKEALKELNATTEVLKEQGFLKS